MSDAAYEDVKNTLSSIPKYVAERLKLPIVILYLSLVVLFNWDVLLYLIFQKSSIICKIHTVKSEYYPLMNYRLLKALGISIISALLLPSVQIAINWIFGFVKRFETDRVNALEISDAKHQKNVLDRRTGNLERQELQAKLQTSEASRLELVGKIEELNKKISIEKDSIGLIKKVVDIQTKEINQRKAERIEFLILIEQTKEEVRKYIIKSGHDSSIVEERIVGFLDKGTLHYSVPFVLHPSMGKDTFMDLFMFLRDTGLGVASETKQELILTKYGELYRKFHQILNDEELYPSDNIKQLSNVINSKQVYPTAKSRLYYKKRPNK